MRTKQGINLDAATHERLTKILSKAPTKHAWDRVGLHHHHGINLPIFSLRTEKSSGIGEYLDLIPLVDWCESLGLDVLQLLPLNDAGYESSPYNALSSLALNPAYLSLWALPLLDDFPYLKGELVRFHKYKTLQRIPYEAILNAKLAFLEQYHTEVFPHFEKMPEYQAYLEKNSWLLPYALFKLLKKANARKGWSLWDKEVKNPSHTFLKKLYKEEKKQLDFFLFMQYLCHKQLKEVKLHAGRKGVFLKGDIPILISPESLDVWLNRGDFDLAYSVGSPPDPFSAEGQNWGFPSYRWDTIEENGFSWWQNRISTASEYYDIFRVDHIVGFYRLWLIERGQKAIDGFFRPSDKLSMVMQGEKILKKLLSFTDMLPIGEDLSLETDHIRASMHEMGIPGTRIPRWEKHFRTDDSYVRYDEYPAFTLTSVSTHDSETLSQWWKHFPQEAKKFCHDMNMKYHETLDSTTLYKLLSDSHKTPSLFHINLLSEYLALYPELVWEDPEEERINLPGTVLPSNWCYRTRPTLEQITSHKALADSIRSML